MARGFLDDEPRDDDDGGESMRRGDVELAGRVIRETDRAVIFADGRKETVVPKSLLRRRETDRAHRFDIITVPEWFAKKEGLL